MSRSEPSVLETHRVKIAAIQYPLKLSVSTAVSTGGDFELFRDFREQCHVVHQQGAIQDGNAEGHLRLVVDEDNSRCPAVCRASDSSSYPSFLSRNRCLSVEIKDEEVCAIGGGEAEIRFAIHRRPVARTEWNAINVERAGNQLYP